jgi:ADP-ribose pyrophosphatase YjhB (NUDIX family)
VQESIDLHHIQKSIIEKLSNNNLLRFSELQPKDIPNNVFTYHLKRLESTGYIKHYDRKGYAATRKALKTIHYTERSSRHKISPILLTAIYVSDSNNRVLLLKRKNKPFASSFGIPSGTIHQDESIFDAAKRELYEKTGLIPSLLSPLSYAGVIDFKYRQSTTGDIFVHCIAFIYKITNIEPTEVSLGEETRFGSLDWSTLTRPKILPEVRAIVEIIKSGNQAISSYDFDEPEE